LLIDFVMKRTVVIMLAVPNTLDYNIKVLITAVKEHVFYLITFCS